MSSSNINNNNTNKNNSDTILYPFDNIDILDNTSISKEVNFNLNDLFTRTQKLFTVANNGKFNPFDYQLIRKLHRKSTHTKSSTFEKESSHHNQTITQNAFSSKQLKPLKHKSNLALSRTQSQPILTKATPSKTKLNAIVTRNTKFLKGYNTNTPSMAHNSNNNISISRNRTAHFPLIDWKHTNNNPNYNDNKRYKPLQHCCSQRNLRVKLVKGKDGYNKIAGILSGSESVSSLLEKKISVDSLTIIKSSDRDWKRKQMAKEFNELNQIGQNELVQTNKLKYMKKKNKHQHEEKNTVLLREEMANLIDFGDCHSKLNEDFCFKNKNDIYKRYKIIQQQAKVPINEKNLNTPNTENVIRNKYIIMGLFSKNKKCYEHIIKKFHL